MIHPSVIAIATVGKMLICSIPQMGDALAKSGLRLAKSWWFETTGFDLTRRTGERSDPPDTEKYPMPGEMAGSFNGSTQNFRLFEKMKVKS